MSNELALTTYDAKVPATFGNKFLTSLVMQAGLEEEAAKLQATASEAKVFLAFEMTRAIFDLSTRHEDVDVYAIFGKAKDVEKLNTKVLMHMGVLKREVTKDDDVVYNWTDPAIQSLYEYSAELKEKDAAEFTRRFNNRKRLNSRFSDAFKAVAALKDRKLSPDDLFYSENEETGESVPTIRNAPKEIAGDNSTVQLGSRKPIVGATMSPTMTSLVKIAENKHKEAKPVRADKDENRNGVAQMGMSDADFGAIVNTLKRALIAQEGVFTVEMINHLRGLSSEVTKVIAAGPTKKTEEKKTEEKEVKTSKKEKATA